MRRPHIAIALTICALLALSAILAGSRPEPVSAEGAVAVDAGGVHTCAVTAATGVRCWGGNGFGQLGDGTKLTRAAPVDVKGLESGAISVTAGAGHSCALTSGGGVKCWGDNSRGQLGDGSTTGSTNPVDVVGLASGITAVAAGGEHTCALTQEGRVKCWGRLTGSTTPVDLPDLGSGVAAVSAGDNGICVISSAGGVACKASYGSQPGVMSGLESGIAAVSAGTARVCAVTTDGAALCSHRFDAAIPVPGLGSGVVDVAVGMEHACVLTDAGGVKCWGMNNWGELGDGTTTSSDTPVDVVGIANSASAIAAGGDHTCALMADASIRCWGWGGSGQLGDGTVGNSTTPVDVLALKPGSCPPEGCSTPSPGPVPVPDCPDLPPTSGPPGMSLTGPAVVLVGDTFAVCVNADPAPSTAVSGFATEVVYPRGLLWAQRKACASTVGRGEVMVTVGGSLPGACMRAAGPDGQARHGVLSALAPYPLPALDPPLGRLLEIDVTCSLSGSKTLILTAAAEGYPFGAAYFPTKSSLPLQVTTIYHDGQQVADIHNVTCLDPGDRVDTDKDGCIDVRELTSEPADGGYRDPASFWDFYDVPAAVGSSKDKSVTAQDIFALIARVGAEGDPAIDPLSAPPAAGYHPAFDRGAVVGPNAWNLGPADGSITAADVFALLAQFGHSCR